MSTIPTASASSLLPWCRMVPSTRSGRQLPLRKAQTPTFNFTVGAKTTPQLRDGSAHLIIEATSGGLFHGTTRWEREVGVVTQPPLVSGDSDQHYLYLGMADLATMNVAGSYSSAGVRVGDQTFRAWPMPGGKPGQFSLFAFAWNMPPGTIPLVYASNSAGNDVTTPLTVRLPQEGAARLHPARDPDLRPIPAKGLR